MKYKYRNLPLAMLSGIFVSCGTSTKLTAHWVDKTYQKEQIKKVLILGITKRDAIRRLFEDDMVKKLDYHGVERIPSYEVFPMDQKLDTNTFQLHFKVEGFDVGLTAQLVSADKETKYDPGYASGAYGGYRGGFYRYYGSSYDYMNSPGYTFSATNFIIEAHLYDTTTEKLVWAGMSETFNPSDEQDVIRSLNQTKSRVLNKQGFFPKVSK